MSDSWPVVFQGDSLVPERNYSSQHYYCYADRHFRQDCLRTLPDLQVFIHEFYLFYQQKLLTPIYNSQ